MRVSVVIPAKDERENIGNLLAEIQAVQAFLSHGDDLEIVVVDDGSRDDTYSSTLESANALSSCRVRCIRHLHSAGQSAALLTGVRHASGQWIATLDGDGQNNPADLTVMIARAKQITSVHFCIAGNRWQRKDTPWKRFQSRFANGVRNALLRDGVPDTGCGLKLFPRDTFLVLPWFDHMHRFIPALIRSQGGEIAIVDVTHRERQGGQSKYTAWNRLWVGIVDLFGVMWLQRRSAVPMICKDDAVQEVITSEPASDEATP